MRFKIKLDIDTLPVEDIVVETSKVLNKILGNNNKWHDLEIKPHSCSFIYGGELKNRNVVFNGNSHFYINSEDSEVISAIVSNTNIDFNIEENKVFKEYNLLSVKDVRYNRSGKTKWVTDENKEDFIQYVKEKYLVDIEIFKIKNRVVHYKNGSNISVSDLLIKCNSDKNVANLFESGIGGSCSLGFGFVKPIKKK